MKRVRASAPARAGLLGNPSDVYGGRTIALAVEGFSAEVEALESPRLRILPTDADHDRFDGLDDLVADVRANGYYGGVRLVKAALKRLAEHCAANGLEPAARNFTISYATTIPRGVGLGGSSAIVTAVLRAATEMLEVEIPKPLLPSLALEVETEELGIAAGLQDRVSQLYGGLTYMDLDPALIRRQGHGRYETLDRASLPPLFLAWRPDSREPSGRAHANVRALFQQGDRRVRATMAAIAELADHGRSALAAGDHEELGRLMDRNVELRARLFDLDPRHLRLVEIAREHGAAANYSGSGGAVVGLGPSGPELEPLRRAYTAEGARLIEL